jgi:uncharacterized protein (DUF1800 family)
MRPVVSKFRAGVAAPSWWTAAALTTLLLAACGGGGGGDGSNAATSATAAAASSSDSGQPSAPADSASSPAQRPVTRADAARFLTRATFGPTPADIDKVMTVGTSAWIDGQLAIVPTSHRAYWDAADAAIKAVTPTSGAGQDQVWESFWKQAVTGPDQLRLRMVYALSQIFVISAVDSNVGAQPRALAAWLDMLGDKGLGSYRDLLEAVSLHPMLGLYLTSLHNQKADSTGRVPDENYAREVMQLFSIGLARLNTDGTPVLVNGKPVETYTPADITGLARVFTGWSYACANTSSSCFNGGSTGGANPVIDPDRYIKPMMAYPQYHSTEAKTFLGVTIPVQTTANPAASLKVALDTLAAHPNAGPFISRQLIQRLVTSNPTPAYVQSVAAVFADNGAGVRGDMKAVLRAILDNPAVRVAGDNQVKLREPVLRLSAYLRAFPHQSDTGNWKVGNTDNASNSLGQTPLRAGSVFNFYRPGYVAPGSQAAAASLVAPEMQLLNETSAAGWVNAMRDNLSAGVGQTNGTVNGVVLNRRDLQRDWSAETALTTNPLTLVQSVTDKLLASQATDALRSDIATAIGKIAIPTLNAVGTNQPAIDAAKRNRVNAAVLLTLATPEFLIQK